MIVTIEQIQAALIKFIDQELVSKANGLGKFMICFMAPSIPAKATNMIGQIKASGMTPELFDENGGINLDEAYKRAKDAMAKAVKVPIPGLGYNADAQDIEVLYNLIKNS